MRTSTSSTSQLSVCGEREFSFRIPCNNSWQKKGAMIRDAFPSLSKTRKQRRLFQQRLLIPPIPSGRWFYFFSSCFCAKLRRTNTTKRATWSRHTTRTNPSLSEAFAFGFYQCSVRDVAIEDLLAGNFHRNGFEKLQGTHFCCMTRKTTKVLGKHFPRRFPQLDFSSPLELEHQRPGYQSLQPQLFNQVPRRVRKIRFVWNPSVSSFCVSLGVRLSLVDIRACVSDFRVCVFLNSFVETVAPQSSVRADGLFSISFTSIKAFENSFLIWVV